MSLDRYARRFFEILREQKDDSSGISLYTDTARRHMHERALPYLEQLPDDFCTLLDVGCGAGFDSAYFAKLGKEVTAITANPTPAQLEYAADNGFEIREMDMNNLAYADCTFDAILCKHVLEHSISPLGSLYEMRRVLRPQGYLFLVVPPHHEELVESGHFTQGWSIGQLVYCLCVAGFDVKNGAFRARPGNIEAVVRPAAAIPTGRGLYELKDFMPEPVQRVMRDDLHGAFPAAAFSQIKWPFATEQRDSSPETLKREEHRLAKLFKLGRCVLRSAVEGPRS